jgi:spermidine synthase
VTRLVGRWLPEAERAPLSDGRVRLHHLDGRLWIQKADSDFYDVVIMQLPDPYTAQINRFYTLQFFAQTVRILKSDGVLAFRASSAENYVTPLQARYLGTLMHTAAAVFTSVRMTPGEEAVILARAGPGALTLSPDELLKRLENRGVTARYFSSSWLPFHLTQQRLETVAGIQAGSADLNTDFRPVSYFYDILLWSRRHGGVLPAVLETIQWIRTWQVLLAGLLPAAALALVPRRKGSRSAGYCLLTTGAATITVQVVLLVAYQALSGYVYSRVSLFAALFMAGLALGAWAALRASHTNRAKLKRLLLCCQFGMAVWCLSVAGTLVAVERGAASPGVLILWLALPSGVIGGLVFPLASAMRSTPQWGVDRLAASSYALDLTGAATGILLGSVVLIPILGLIPACLFAASLSGGGAMLLAATPSTDGMGG